MRSKWPSGDGEGDAPCDPYSDTSCGVVRSAPRRFWNIPGPAGMAFMGVVIVSGMSELVSCDDLADLIVGVGTEV
jgi:hypothetical protein